MSQQLAQTPEAERILMAPVPYPPHVRPDGPIGEPITFPEVTCPIEVPVYFRANGELKAIQTVQLSPTFQWHYTRLPAE